MFIRKIKIKSHIEKARYKERYRCEKEYESIINIMERDHLKKIKRIKEQYDNEIDIKNKELKKSRQAWDSYRDKVSELAELIFKLKNFMQLFKINSLQFFQHIAGIQESIERAERFIVNNETKINKMLCLSDKDNETVE
ncbi:MAG: hypothetical protein WC554_11475 [Clostridia bacterium]|jgi:hypothetical protein